MVARVTNKGLSGGVIGNKIPAQWSASWFQQFVTQYLVNADARNAIAGPGISIVGNIGTPATISLSSASSASGAAAAAGGSAVAGAVGADPTALVGLIAVDGTAKTFMTSDSAPALDTSIIPTWTGLHTFSAGITSTGPAGNWAGTFQGDSTAGSSYGLYISAGTSSSDYALRVQNYAHTDVFFVRGDSTVVANNWATISQGNCFTNGAPSAGTTLNGVAVSHGFELNDGSNHGLYLFGQGASNAYFDLFISRYGSTANTSQLGPNISFGDLEASEYHTIQHSGGQLEFWYYTYLGSYAWQQAAYFNGYGGLVINAPFSGYGLQVTGPAGDWAQLITGSSTASNSYGLVIQAGTNSSDYALDVQSQAGTSYLTVTGAGAAVLSNGLGLTIDASASGYPGLYIPSSVSTAGQSYGAAIHAGTNSSDYALDIYNQAVSTHYFQVRGDGLVSLPALTASTGTTLIESGNAIYSLTSSRDYKINIEDANEAALANVLKLRPVWYRSNSKTTSDRADFSWYGLIAEEVHEVDPRLVNYWDQGRSDKGMKPKSVGYERIAPLLIPHINRLYARVEALEAKR